MIFLYLIIVFFSFLFFMSLLSAHFSDPYFIHIFYGLPGCGKSIDIAKYAIKVNNKKTRYNKIYCNMNDVMGTYYYDLKKLIDINKNKNDDEYIIPFEENSVVVIDEGGYFINNRDWKNFSKFLQYLCRYVRHHKIYLRIYSQSLDVDKVVRDLASTHFILKKYFNCITITKPINKDIGIGTDFDGNGRMIETYKYQSIFNYGVTFIPRYVGLFDSHSKLSKYDDNNIFNTSFINYDENNKYCLSIKLYIFKIFKTLYVNIKTKIMNLINRKGSNPKM